jgi:hypothetical protein
VTSLCWPDGAPYKTEVFRVDLEVADRDVDWNSDYVAEAKLCDGRKVTVRMPMSAWREKDYIRVARDPIVVDVAAISPPAPPPLPARVEDTTATDALTGAASALVRATGSLTAAARIALAQRPRKATATRNDDGSLTVMYDDGEECARPVQTLDISTLSSLGDDGVRRTDYGITPTEDG